jgi:hypothetical protein
MEEVSWLDDSMDQYRNSLENVFGVCPRCLDMHDLPWIDTNTNNNHALNPDILLSSVTFAREQEIVVGDSSDFVVTNTETTSQDKGKEESDSSASGKKKRRKQGGGKSPPCYTLEQGIVWLNMRRANSLLRIHLPEGTSLESLHVFSTRKTKVKRTRKNDIQDEQLVGDKLSLDVEMTKGLLAELQKAKRVTAVLGDDRFYQFDIPSNTCWTHHSGSSKGQWATFQLQCDREGQQFQSRLFFVYKETMNDNMRQRGLLALAKLPNTCLPADVVNQLGAGQKDLYWRSLVTGIDVVGQDKITLPNQVPNVVIYSHWCYMFTCFQTGERRSKHYRADECVFGKLFKWKGLVDSTRCKWSKPAFAKWIVDR